MGIDVGLGCESSKNDDSMKATKLTFLVFTLVLGILFVIQAPNANAATITSINPTALIPGDTVTIIGSGFGAYVEGQGGYITFSGYAIYAWPGSENYSWSDSSITVTVPIGIVPGHIYVNYYDNGYQTIEGPIYSVGKPFVETMSTTTDLRSGETLTIFGSGFGTSGEVYFNNVAVVYSYSAGTTWSSKKIILTIPSVNLSPGLITIHYNQGGYASGTITGPSYTLYAPRIDSISSHYIIAGQTITINGRNFGTSKGSVSIGGTFNYNVGVEVISWSDTSITFKFTSILPSHFFTLTSNTGTLQISNGTAIGMVHDMQLMPNISTVSDSMFYPGSAILIKGSSFGDLQGTVNVDGINAVVTSWSVQSITATIPSIPYITYQGYRDVQVVVNSVVVSNNSLVVPSSPKDVRVYRVISGDPLSYLQANLAIVGIPESWSIPVNKRVTVAVIDDGVYINHPDLRNNIWVNTKESIGNRKDDDKNGYVDDIYGWDFISNSGEMTTRGSHGTMVAGIIAATRDNNEGIAGINPNATIMPLIACDSSGCTMSNVSKAIYYAANNGADIINLSLSTFATTGYTTSLDDAIRYAHNKGVIIVSAAGNGDTEGGLGQDLNRIPQTPVCNDAGTNAVIGVSASANDGYRPTWANYGSNCVDVYAPGVGIVSTAVPASSTIGGFYDVGDGTSFSAPIITGLVSLLKQQYPTMPQSEVVARLYRHNKTGIIDAIGFIQEAYIPPTGKVLGVSVTKPIMKSGKIVASGFSINVKGKNIIVKPFSKYSGKVATKQITFGDTSLYVFVPQDPYAKGAVYVYNGDGKKLQVLKPFGKYITSGMNVSFGVDSDSNTAWLAIGEAKGSRVAVYQIASNGVWLKSNLSKVTSKKGVPITVKWLKVYANQLGLVTMVTGKPSTVKTWKLNVASMSFTADSSVKSNRYRFSGKDVLLR